MLQYQLAGVVRGVSLNQPVGEVQPIELGEEDTAYGMYVDNIITLGARHSNVAAGLRGAIGHCNKVGLHIGEMNAPRRRLPELGMEFDGARNTISYPAERCVLLQKATYYVAEFRNVQWKTVQRLAGHFAWAFVLRREFFAIFGAIYHFIDAYKHCEAGQWVQLWPTVRAELRTAADVLPLCSYDLGLDG
ncbi:MAG: hypothetical protein QGG31_04660, partial [Anaerolineales bacterium]|nr:hypothetical protein [Anaerolineales bacterium]